MSNNQNPLGQAISFLTRIQGKGVSSATLEAHFSAGLVSDLFEVGDPTAVDREAFRKVLGLHPRELITEIDFGKTLSEMIAAAGNDWVNPNITVENFPVVGSGVKRFRNKVFTFDGSISSETGITLIEEKKFVPATHVHGFAFSAKFPGEGCPYLCLGSSAEVDGVGTVVGFGVSSAKRDANLYSWASAWAGYWHLLGVQEISGVRR